MSLEKIVRPYQQTDVFDAPSVRLPGKPADEVQEPATWQGSANSSWQEDPWPIGNIKYEEDKSRRVTENVRVENPSDSSQFVELERIKKAVFVGNNGQELPISMNWDQ